MNVRSMLVLAMAAVLAASAAAQQDDPAPQSGENPPGSHMGQATSGQDMPSLGRMGQGVVGTVTRVASDHFSVKTMKGDTYTVHFSANTRIFKQPAEQTGGSSQTGGFDRTPPTPIQSSAIQVGDVIMARGQVEPGSKSVGAIFIVQMDPERARRLQQMEASFGKTWLAGRITAIDGAKITLVGGPNSRSYSFVADQNTRFRSWRQPITLADLKVGEAVRVEGAIKDGQFVATTVDGMMIRAMGGPAPRHGKAPPQ